MISPTGKQMALAPVRPNVGTAAEYRRRLDALIEEMHRSLAWWLGAAYKQHQPEISQLAQDASPARELLAVLAKLKRRWLGKFDELAPDLARWFAIAAKDRSDTALRHALRKGGFTVRFRLSRATNDALQAAIGENVALIRSIPERHLAQVEGAVMRSVQQGRDLGSLAAELQQQLGVSKRRAALISRDQNNKATAVIARVRQQELGITQARWVHSGAGKEPRPTHVKAGRDGVVFDLATGWYDPHEKRNIWPGELINCRCVARPVLPGFS